MSTFDKFEVEAENDSNALYKVNIAKKGKLSKQKFLAGWKKYGDKIILLTGIFLIAAISFEAGFLKGQKNQKNPIEINIPSENNLTQGSGGEALISPANLNNSAQATNSAINSSASNGTISEIDNKNCPYVASKNSDKFHLASCPWAKRIKAENRVCFSSKEEAEKMGYQGAKCCIK